MRRNRRATFKGLGPGTAFETRDIHGVRRGAVTCILGKASGPSHLITAGHIFHRDAQRTPLFAAALGARERVAIGHLVLNWLVVQGGERQRDVALVELTPDGVALCQATSAISRLSGAVHPDLLKARRVQAWRTIRDQWSLEAGTHVRAEPTRIHARAWRDGYVVRDVIGVSGFVMLPGDSGTALCSVESAQQRELFGTCIGQLGAVALFEPVYPLIEHVLTALDKDIDLWPPPA